MLWKFPIEYQSETAKYGDRIRQMFLNWIYLGIFNETRKFGGCAALLGDGLIRFSDCAHTTDPVCFLCSSELQHTYRIVQESVPSAARLGKAIAEASMMQSNSPLRQLCRAAYSVIQKSICVRAEYLGRVISSSSGASVVQYKSKYQYCN